MLPRWAVRRRGTRAHALRPFVQHLHHEARFPYEQNRPVNERAHREDTAADGDGFERPDQRAGGNRRHDGADQRDQGGEGEASERQVDAPQRGQQLQRALLGDGQFAQPPVRVRIAGAAINESTANGLACGSIAEGRTPDAGSLLLSPRRDFGPGVFQRDRAIEHRRTGA